MKALVVQLYQTGDVVLSTHIPKVLRQIVPGAQVDFLTFEVNKPVLENNPDINEILTIRRNDGFFKFIRTIRDIRSRRYDAVIDLHNNPRSGYITFLSGAEKRITYSGTNRWMLYNEKPERLKGIAGQIKLSLLQPFKEDFRLEDYDYKPLVHPSPESVQRVDTLLKEMGIVENDLLVTVSPTHKRDTRRWSIEHFMDTARYLTRQYEAKVMLTYGPGEKEYITENVHEMPENVFLMPELHLRDFIALIGRAGLHIGNDSAPHHIATAQDVPTFIVLGSSNTGWIYGSPEHTYAMLGMDCQPCGKSTCAISPEIPCMKNLTFEMIKDKLDSFIKENVNI